MGGSERPRRHGFCWKIRASNLRPKKTPLQRADLQFLKPDQQSEFGNLLHLLDQLKVFVVAIEQFDECLP